MQAIESYRENPFLWWNVRPERPLDHAVQDDSVTNTESTGQLNAGAGGVAFAIVGGFSAHSGGVVDSTGQACAYTQTCVLGGIGIFGDLEGTTGVTYSQTPLQSGTTETLGAFVRAGFIYAGGGSLSTPLVNEKLGGGVGAARAAGGTGGGVAIGFQYCTIQTYCGD